jgi:hypothetical protein
MLSGKQEHNVSDKYESLLDETERLRDQFKRALDDRDAGKTIFKAPPGFTLDGWVQTLHGEVQRLTDILVKAGRA